jgi:hypothetical protein
MAVNIDAVHFVRCPGQLEQRSRHCMRAAGARKNKIGGLPCRYRNTGASRAEKV